MPRLRRNLLQSDLQRRYIEEIGDGFRSIPPELVISAPGDTSVSYKKGISLESVSHVLPSTTNVLIPAEPAQPNNYQRNGAASPSTKDAKVNNKKASVK